ncbi:hypothetical protein P3T36_006374 [Kitasatospora sp. MAP12-15]|uniref:hypothetical protein n=1 Tax=unclassified Kitasatospora TaxID=2633591 RepID=UPI0024769EA2|nr:hypothetical protein [Kitasatospora sp. MAP12-44]MDH6107915.1 hypothetical protein [Kitasatospora sp. MAP12-44]
MSNALLQPRYWLVQALAWPQADGPYRECAQALVPPMIPRQMVPRDAADILTVADAYQGEHPTRRLVFFSDLTRWLDGQGSDWGRRGTDWEGGLRQLEEAPAPGLYLTLSQYHHTILGDASREGMTIYFSDGLVEKVTPEIRDAARAFMQQTLERDWPGYISRLIADGKIRTA